MASITAALKRHAEELQSRGFALVHIRASPELVRAIKENRTHGESIGQTLERLVLGKASPRPKVHTGGC